MGFQSSGLFLVVLDSRALMFARALSMNYRSSLITLLVMLDY